jgi:hypothetical protein
MKIALLAFLGLLSLQPPPSLLGTWTAEKDGVTFARLELRSQGASISGEMALGSISFDKAGGLREVGAAPAALTPLAKFAHAGNVVSFTWLKDSDEDRFRFQFTAGGVGELTMLLPEDVLAELKAEGVPLPQPVVLRRIGPF